MNTYDTPTPRTAAWRVERNADIVARYNAGDDIDVIATTFELSPSSVKGVLRSARSRDATAVTRPTRDSTLGTRDQRMVAMYRSGATLEVIGDRFLLSRERVRQILKLHGVDRRTPAENNDAARTRSLAAYGPQIDAAFADLRSISKVVKALQSDTLHGSWIRDHLASRSAEQVRVVRAKHRWSDEQIFAVLSEASGGTGALSIMAYQHWRTRIYAETERRIPGHCIIVWRFGSWNNAVALAGLVDAPNGRRYQRRWHRDDALRAATTFIELCLSRDTRPLFSGYEAWARTQPDVPSGAYMRVLTGMSWSQLVRYLTPVSVAA